MFVDKVGLNRIAFVGYPKKLRDPVALNYMFHMNWHHYKNQIKMNRNGHGDAQLALKRPEMYPG